MIRTMLSASRSAFATLRRVPSLIRSVPSLLLGLVTDPRLALLVVPVAGVALLMGMNGPASNAAVTTTTTTTIVEAAPATTAAPDIEVLGAAAVAPAEQAGGSGSGGGGARSIGGGSGSSSRRSAGAGSVSVDGGGVAAGLDGPVADSAFEAGAESTTTVAGEAAPTSTMIGGVTTTVPGETTPEPVIAETPNPILMLVLAVGVAAIAGNGLSARRRLASAQPNRQERSS